MADDRSPTRRTFLKASGTAGAAGLAGCSMLQDSESGADDPAQRVTAFYDALAAPWTEYFHTETGESPIRGVETTTVETDLGRDAFADRADLSDSEASAVVEGAETALVEVTVDLQEGETSTERWLLATEDGEWQLVARVAETTQTEETGEDSTEQVANNINVIGSVGDVTDGGDGINVVRLTVQRAPGSSDLDLSALSIQYVGDNGFANFVHASETDENAFYVNSISSETDDGIITDDSDRYQLIIPFGTAAVDDDLASTDPVQGSQNVASEIGMLGAGKSAELEITTADRATRNAFISVPEAIGDEETVTI